MHISIIGLGNSLLGDDAAGIYVCERLAERRLHLDAAIDMRNICSQGLFPEYVEDVSGADLVVFIDAAVRADSGVGARCGLLRSLPPAQHSVAEGGGLESKCSLSGSLFHESQQVAVDGHSGFQFRRIYHEEIMAETSASPHSTPFHGLSLFHFLRLCKEVYGRLPADIWLYTVAAQDFTPFRGLSDGVREACEGVICELFIKLVGKI